MLPCASVDSDDFCHSTPLNVVRPETKLSVTRMGFFYRTIFIISVKSTANEYIIYTVKNARNFPFGNQKAAEERQDIPLP